MSFQVDNNRNQRIYNNLKNINPKFAKHMIMKNVIVEQFAINEYGGMDILDFPVCTKCEKPCTWHQEGAYHMECGTYIKEPITMRDYLIQQIKLPPEIIEAIEQIALEGEEVIDGNIVK